MSHILEIPDELYTALKAAADVSGTTHSAGLPHMYPKPQGLKKCTKNAKDVQRHLLIYSLAAWDASGVVAKNDCLRGVAQSLRTTWKQSGERGACDAL